MLRAIQNPTLVLLRHGRPVANFPLETGASVTLGRSRENAVVLDDPSVSRRHAEIAVSPNQVTLRDLKSRNGVQVNGVPRREATLQPGDRIKIGAVELEFAAGFVRPVSTPPQAPDGSANPLMETHRARAALPDPRQERHLAALYHLCFRVTEGIAPDEADRLLLDLLLEGVRAAVAQYYSPDDQLLFSAAAEKVKGVPKFAPYLLDKFRQLPEAATYTAADLGRYQQKLGAWNFLVCPLPTATGDGASVVVLLRAAGWEEFSTADRLLLNAAMRLWPRGRQRNQEISTLRRENDTLRKRTAAASGLLGDSPALTALRTRLDRIARTKATALITGETGSGKEVVAQYLHDHSPRAKQRFIKVNCAAIPHALMESELFGHVKGAFTDAKSDHQGKFQLAHGGTLFLDEIGELPLPVQSKLLRALESGEVERIGSERVTKVDVRILAATNRDLRAEVRAGNFREDLLYRLEVATIAVPPLRDHPDDIPVLARHFLEQFCAENGLAAVRFAPDALAVLQKHPWPGNVRELRNVVQRLALEADEPVLTAGAVKAGLR
ncbi:MAG: sigma 54-interacting transcriptional regulator [Opitutaceae bacterium]|nr:sigma 54-interacting transcriptional regulator [Opitutaceae bacterium]